MEIHSLFVWYVDEKINGNIKIFFLIFLNLRYQQKIGTYDKQKWETKIEQRAQRIYGLNHIQTRSTKPNTDLIDLDLVRGKVQ